MLEFRAMTRIKTPAVAGLFYPDSPRELSAVVGDFLDRAEVESPVRPHALIAPHAGYVYSGPTAGFAFTQLAADAGEIRRIVLLGPAHRVALRGLALPGCDAFATPLGVVPVAVEAARRIASLPQVVDHPLAHQEEHSLEVELPFLQMILEEFELLPLVVGDVTGHGAEAALLMTTARAIFRMKALQMDDMAEIINAMNRQLVLDMLDTGRFMTLFCLRLETRDKRAQWIRAGHTPALIYHPDQDRFTELKGEGLALGVDAAYRYQQQIDRGEKTIVGVNKYRAKDETPVEIRDIDNTAVRESQVARLEKVRAGRNEEACRAALAKLTEAAQDKTGNLLELAIIAARERATVGEISDALEDVYGRYRAMTRSISGVYGAAYENDESFQAIWKDVEAFAEKEGRRPRMLVCKLGQDGHDRGAKVIATGFADLGFDVDIGPLFQTPEEAVREAIENDVHAIGISSQAAGHKTLVPQVIEGLKAEGASDIIVICGGVIPPQDYETLYDAGVSAIYGPGTNIVEAAREVLEKIQEKRAS